MYSVTTIFPTVLYMDSYNGNMFDEYVFCKRLETITVADGYMVSTNRNVLDAPELSKLKSCLQHAVNVYTKDIMKYESDISISESWVTTLPKGNSLPTHNHPDSIISGVIYFTNEGNTSIVFENDVEGFNPNVSQQNPLNSKTWKVSGKKGGFVLFPSNLKHRVDVNDNDMDRVSLSFNTSLVE